MSLKRVVSTARIIAGLLGIGVVALCMPAVYAQTVMIGDSMDRGLPVHPGDTIRAGYQVSLDDHGNRSGGAATLSVTNSVVIVTVKCSNGKQDDDDKDHGKGNDKQDKNHGPDHETITINLSPRTFAIPANGNFSSPENDYQGQAKAPSNLCGGKGGTTDGATFSANSAFTCHANASEGCCHKVCFRFHVLYNNRGGTFSHKDCENEKFCASPTKRGNGHCCDKDKDRD
jgi:hypothetical protein